ncbi:protein piccolo isoform X2 [Hemitrygon akajei]|uniref:protein piccolo isoform X2 n=1 Tax=Hemitrygon akajei TaxID=2704970 RepID=UPI003BF9AB2D
MMPSFLSDGRPLSAVSSVVNKFGLFDSKAEPEEAARRPVSAPKAQPGPRDPGTAEPPVSAPRTAPSTLCPVCASTELRLHDPGAANYGRCTQCQLLVCSQCGFNPNPHISQVKEWLCLNCQMQRALGMDITSAPASKPQPVPSKQGTPVSAPQVAKQGPAQPTAQKDPAQRPEQAKPLSQPGARKQPLLTKQKSIAASPPQKPKQQSHEQQPPQQVVQKPKPVKQSSQDVSTTQAPETQQASPGAQQRGSKQTRTVDQTTAHQPAGKQKDSDPKIQPQQLKTKGGSAPEPEVVQKERVVEASQAQKPAQVAKAPQEKQTVGAAPEPLKQPPLKTESKPTQPKEDQGKPSQRPPAAKPVSSQAPPETQRTQKPPEQSRRFSLNLGSSAQPPPFQPTTPQESVTGRLFGFGASLFSQASTLISAAPPPPDQHKPGPKQQPAPPAPAASSTAQKSLKPDTGKREIKPQAAEKSEQKATVTAQGAKETGPAKKDATVKQTTEVSAKGLKAMEPKMGTPSESTCPLCKTVLNIGSSTAPNYNTCTECKAIVCNLCGFNPMPHLTEVEEWLCLTCQTQRALSGQLGDPGKMPPLLPMPSKAPVKQSSPGPPPSKQPPSQKSPPPVSSSPSKSVTEQAVVPRSKEMEQEKAKAAQVAKTKEAASTAPAKPAETSPTVKQDAALREELQAPKPGAAQQTLSAEEKRLQSIPEQKAAAEKQQAGAPEPEHAKTVAGKEAAEVKDVKAEEALSVTGPVEPRSDTTKEQTEQMRKPEQVEKVKVTAEKEEDKSDSSAILQQRSPQGLSDTGYSSDGISSSLGETTSTLPSEDKDLLKEPVKKDSISQESCPSSPSDLAKLESTVLSILEAQANTQNNEKPGQYKDPYGLYTDQERERHRPRTLPITPESYSSDEEDLEDIQEEDEDALEDENHGDTLRTKETKELGGSQDDAAVRRQRYDSLEDSSESEHSPRPHRQRTISIGSSSSDSHGSGDEEEFIRKQIIEMSAEEDESGSDEDEFIRGQLKEISTKEHPESKGSAVKHRRLSKKSSTSHDDDPGRRHSWHDDDDDDEIFAESPDAKCRETKSQDNDELSVSAGGGLRRFKTIDLNSSMANRYAEDSENKRDALYYDEEPELEMESLTDSPEDRSRGEGSSSLHATSSFTPGTSPTSVSSLDEDSDSSPSHKKVLGESKQQRKARHRTHGPLLPTIEDSSEEEELREEEELLREQERQRELEQQQRKSSSKKSKKDKDELRAQRRREHPKTPPSNLSPIEDASPTEELRQAAEMEELHRSSCSEYSPSNESESEGFEISPEKILEVQKVYKLPTSVLLYSPTDDKSSNVMGDALSPKSLRTAEEAYEEMMQKAKLLQNQKGPDEAFEKEPLYGGMLIEDYIYESLVEDTYNGTADNRFLNIGQETGAGLFQEAEKKLRSPDEIYEEIMRKSPTYSDTKQYGYSQPSDMSLQKQQLASTLQASGQANFTLSSGAFEPSTNFDKQLLDADTAYEELMKRQRALLTPGTSPTQPSSPESPESVVTHGSVVTLPPGSTRLHDGRTVSMPRLDSEASQTAMAAGVMHSIPDVKITQHFTTEEDIEPEYAEQYSVKGHGTPESVKHGKSEATTSPMAPTSTPSCTIPSTAPTTGTPPVCYTLAKDSVAAGKSTSVAPTSTVKVTVSSVTCVMGRTSHVHPTSVTAPSETMPDHVIISVPPTPERSHISTSAPVAARPGGTPSSVCNIYGKGVPSVSVTISGGSGTTQTIPKPVLPASEYGKITTTVRAPSVSTTSTTVFTTVTCTAPQPPQITSWDASHPYKVGPFVTRPISQSVTSLPFSPPPPPPPPPLPPLTSPKPFIISKKSSVPQIPTCGIGPPVHTSVRTGVPSTLDQSSLAAGGKLFHPMPPPVPPKPASVPTGLGFLARPTEGIRPAIPPKPSLAHLPLTVHRPSESQQKPSTSTTTLSLNLTSPGDFKLTSPTSPMSPLSNKSSPKLTVHSQATYVVITLPSEPGTPTESITCQSPPTQLIASSSKSPALTCLPSTISLAHFTQSLETQKIVEKRKTETVYFYQSLAQGVISTVARELSTEVAQVPVVYNTVPSTGALSVSISIPPDSKYSEQAHLQESKRILDHAGPFLTDVIDLRTLSSLDSAMTGNGMDLSMVPVDGRRQDVMVDAGSVRQGSVVQPTIVNLSTTGPVEQMPLSMQAVPAASVAVVSCSAGTMDTADLLSGPVDLGHAVSLPLQLTAKFDGAAITHAQGAGTSTAEIPINLTCGTTTLVEGWPVSKSSTIAPTGTTNGWIGVEPAEVAAVDLSTTKPHRMMVALDDLTSGVVTAVVEEEDKPVDLTAGRQNVCCDVVYKFPFGRSCSSLAQEPASALPEDRYGYRDDHYVYDRNGPHGYRGFGSMKPSMSDTNLAEAGVFLYKSKHGFDSMGVTDRAVDLTAGKLTAGELMDYSAVCTQPQDHLSKGALSYPETRQAGLPQYSQARIIPTIGSHYGMPSVLRSSGGVVYSSVATPIPSTFAITTQPGSIFSHSLSLHTSGTAPSASGLPQSQSAVGLPLGLDTSTFQPVGTEPLQSGSHVTTVATYPGSSSAGIFMPPEADSAAVPRLSPVVSPASEENKHLLMEREMLEFEKMKQLRLAEELERERHEIQIFREQEKLIVQRELQELQTMKQQLLYQQEEERQAQFMMQQETIAQQQMQLEQIQQLQQQLQQHLEEQKFRQIYHYSYDPSSVVPPQTSADQAVRESQYTTADNGQFWHAQDPSTSVSAMMGNEVPQTESWYAVQSDGLPQHVPRPCLPGSVSEMSLKDVDVREGRPLKKRSSMPRLRAQCVEPPDEGMEESSLYRKIVDSGVQTDDEEGTERPYSSRRRRSKKSVDSSVQTDDEDNQEDWDIPTRRRKSRVAKYADGGTELDKAKHLHFAKLSNIAVQTVAEISVQTEPVGIIRTPSVRARIESKIEIVKHISAPEKTYKGESLGCQTEADSDEQSPPYLSSKSVTTASPQKSDKKRPTPLEIGYSTHLRADSTFQVVPTPPKSPKVLYSPVSPMSPNKEMDTLFEPYEKSSSVDIISQKLAAPELPKSQPLSPRTIKVMQRSMSDPKPLSPTAEETSRLQFQYSDNYMTKSSQNITTVGTQKKVKRTLPNPPPEEVGAPGSQVTFSSAGSVSRRRVCRTNTMARAKILQDIDRELELVERESSKLRKKQAELDEEEKEIDAKLRYLEMGINRRKEALLKEREKRERAYLQGVAEERDYMSDSEVSNIRDTRLDGQRGLERPRTAPQSDYDQFLSSQTQSQAQYATTPSRYTQYQYSTPAATQTQTQYQQQALYHQPVSPYQTQPTYQAVPTITYQQQQSPAPQSQSTAYPHSSQAMMIQQKPRQSTLADLEPKITTHYEVIHNQPILLASTSTDTTYAVPHLSNKYSSLDHRLGLDERGAMASSPMSSISADSYYTDLDPHASRNYVLLDDIGELTKGSSSLTTGFNLHNLQKEVQKSERLLHASEARRAGDVKDFIGTLQASSRLHSYGKAEEDSMEDPYELKLLKQQIKQEFRRGTEGLEHLSGLPHYYHGDSSYRHFAKSEKYSISRLTLEKQAAKQLPPSFIYQKQSKHKKQLLDPKISKFLPIQEARDVEAEYASYMGSMPSAAGVGSRARLLQDDITFGLRKNIRDQQKFLGAAIRSTLDDDIDKAYTSGTRSRPSSVYGLDLSIKRDSSSTSLRIKSQESDPLDMAYVHSTPTGRTKPSSLPISHSRGRIPIVAQNSEEESPLSPVGQPMGMARAAAGPLPPISADTREQFGSSHSLPEVQQHMREESRTRGYDRDIAFIMDDFQHAMSDSEAYHLRREETDWFDKPRESRLEDVPAVNRKVPEKVSHSRQSQPQTTEVSGKPILFNFPHSRVKVQRDVKDQTISGNGLGIKIIGGKEIPGRNGEIGAYIAKVTPGGAAEQTGKLTEGMQVLEWNGIPLTGKTYEEVQCVIGVPVREAEICVRLDLNMLSDSEKFQQLDLKDRTKAGEKQRSPGVDPKQLAAELQKVSQQAPCVVSSASEKGAHSHSGTTSAASSAAPSPGQPASPSVSKKRHSSKPPETASKSHPITGEIQLQMNYDKQVGNLIVHVLQARDLAPRDNNGYSDPFVKVYLLPGRGQVMVVQNASVENKRRTKHVQKSLNPEWNQTVIYKNISMEQLKKKTLEVTVWDYDRISSNDFLGEVLIDLSNASHFDNTLRWYPLKEQTESIDQVRPHSGQSSQQQPKSSVIKSRSHGIFPDPSKEMYVPTIEKSQSSPASSKSSSEGHLRSHGPSRSQSKSSVTQTHLEDAGAAIAAAEAAVQQLRVQPTHKSGQAQNHTRKHRHSIAGVPIQRTQSDNLPSPANENKDQSQLAIRKVMSEGSPKAEGAKSTNHRPTESSISTASSVSSTGSGYNVDSEGSTTGGEGSVFTDTQVSKVSQDTEIIVKDEKHKASDQFSQQGRGPAETNGKTQVMGEIKIALKKEMKTDGEQLLVEILQCRNITYKFKSPDHLPDLYVKLYVINISTQKRVFKKKTRVCRHDREPSFNETFRFSLSPAGHSLQILLVSNGGKFMRKTLIGEAYIWLDKVDLRKRVVNWHKLLVSSTESQRGTTSGFNVQN